MCVLWGPLWREKVLGVKGTAWWLSGGVAGSSCPGFPKRLRRPESCRQACSGSFLTALPGHGHLRRAGCPFSQNPVDPGLASCRTRTHWRSP